MPAYGTVMDWLFDSTHPDHAENNDRYARARDRQADYWADEINEIADDGTNDWMMIHTRNGDIEVPNHEHMNRSRLRVDTRKWLASKLKPKKYSDRQIIDQTVEQKGEQKLIVFTTEWGNNVETTPGIDNDTATD